MSAVLVDTSVWRKYFAGFAAVRLLGELLDEPHQVLVHPWVIGELVLGGLSRREESLLSQLPHAPLVDDDEAIEFIRARSMVRRGIGWVDANLLASAIVGGSRIWTLDQKLASAARSTGAGFEPDAH